MGLRDALVGFALREVVGGRFAPRVRVVDRSVCRSDRFARTGKAFGFARDGLAQTLQFARGLLARCGNAFGVGIEQTEPRGVAFALGAQRRNRFAQRTGFGRDGVLRRLGDGDRFARNG